MDTFEREERVRRMVNARGLTMDESGGGKVERRWTISQPGVFTRRRLTLKQVEEWLDLPKE